ncbi:hypothetical protein CU044_4229 [Streptomyces sp. L-9-10]|nr:hypothetical protein CU044_4229 [Streptomyces sp. L-9-10]
MTRAADGEVRPYFRTADVRPHHLTGGNRLTGGNHERTH